MLPVSFFAYHEKSVAGSITIECALLPWPDSDNSNRAMHSESINPAVVFGAGLRLRGHRDWAHSMVQRPLSEFPDFALEKCSNSGHAFMASKSKFKRLPLLMTASALAISACFSGAASLGLVFIFEISSCGGNFRKRRCFGQVWCNHGNCTCFDTLSVWFLYFSRFSLARFVSI